MQPKRFNNIFRFLFALFDYIAVLGSFILAYVIRRQADVITSLDLVEVPVLNFSFSDFIKIAPLVSLLWMVMFLLSKQYQNIEKRSRLDEIYRIFQGSSAGVLALMIMGFFIGRQLFSRLITIYAWGISIIAVFIARLLLHQIQRFLWRKGIGTTKILVCGLGKIGRQFLEGIRQQGWPGYEIIGILDDTHPNKNNGIAKQQEQQKGHPIITHDPNLVAGFPYLGKLMTLDQLLCLNPVTKIIIGLGNMAEQQILNIIHVAQNKNISTSFIPDVLSITSSYAVSETINSIPLLGPKITRLRGMAAFLKRAIDTSIALLVLFLISPFLLIVAVLVKISSPGPILFSQDRIGRDGNKFKIYKFRSMRSSSTRNPAGETKQWTTANDARRTTIGKIIRKTSIDELPQFWNIVRGDMSLVGPRPEQPVFVEQFTRQIPRYMERHKVKPGLTGWAQVNGWRGNTSIEERLQYDLYYIENWSFLFDLKIVLYTVTDLFKAKEAY